ERLRAILHDPARVAFVLVTIPEAMAFAETARYLEFLRDQGLPVGGLLINRVEQEHNGCAYCRARTAGQKPWLKRMASRFKALAACRVPLLATEVRGLASLRQFAQLSWGDAEARAASPQASKAGAPLQVRQAKVKLALDQATRAADQPKQAASVIEDFNRRV